MVFHKMSALTDVPNATVCYTFIVENNQYKTFNVSCIKRITICVLSRQNCSYLFPDISSKRSIISFNKNPLGSKKTRIITYNYVFSEI